MIICTYKLVHKPEDYHVQMIGGIGNYSRQAEGMDSQSTIKE